MSAPSPAANGFNQKKFNNASIQLKNALSTIANQHVRRYIKEIKNAAIAKARNGYVPQANLNRLKTAEAAAKAAVQIAPETATIGVQTMNDVKKANDLITAIASGQGEINKTANKVFKNAQVYQSLSQNNKALVNKALATRRRNVSENIIQKLLNKRLNNASLNNRFNYLPDNEKEYVRRSS
jgi:hypothetical protein